MFIIIAMVIGFIYSFVRSEKVKSKTTNCIIDIVIILSMFAIWILGGMYVFSLFCILLLIAMMLFERVERRFYRKFHLWYANFVQKLLKNKPYNDYGEQQKVYGANDEVRAKFKYYLMEYLVAMMFFVTMFGL